VISIEKWAGLVTNASPYSLPPGAAVTQVNLQVINPGQLLVRPGLNAVTYSGTSGATVRSAMRYPGASERVVFQDDNGVIRVYTA
jgi:hypothetical protein